MAGKAAGKSGTVWVVAETNADGSLAKISTEVATLARLIPRATRPPREARR